MLLQVDEDITMDYSDNVSNIDRLGKTLTFLVLYASAGTSATIDSPHNSPQKVSWAKETKK